MEDLNIQTPTEGEASGTPEEQTLDPVVQELQQIRQTLSELQKQNDQLKQTNARLAQLASVGEKQKPDACSLINDMFK